MDNVLEKYHTFLDTKMSYGADSGFEPVCLPSSLFGFQSYLSDYAIRKGRAAIFADCGMGKTLIELVCADNFVRKTNKPALILTPLSVSHQTLAEAHKFGIEAHPAFTAPAGANIRVVNYEQLHHFNARDFGSVICDESSILKNFNGVYKTMITEFMRHVPYRLLGTATAAPNDWEELGTSSEALGYFGYMDMLGKFFTTKNKAISSRHHGHSKGAHYDDRVRLRPYAEQDFWRWVASWSRAARKPSDLGFADNGFILPALIENDIEISGTKATGTLFDMEAVNWFEERDAIKRTIPERCEAAADKVSCHDVSIVWCHLDAEARLLKKLIPDSVEISGSDSPERKEEAADWFVNGSEQRRRLISKPKIFGFGMNFQHCNHMVYFPTHSYEAYYQSSRRLWRYGQTRDVIIDRIFTNGGKRILQNLNRKSVQADKMFENLVAHINEAIHLENVYTPKKVSLPKWLQS